MISTKDGARSVRIDQCAPTPIKLELQATKHFRHAFNHLGSLSPITSTESGRGEAPKPEATTQIPTHKQPTKIEDSMLPLYDSVFAEKSTHYDLLPVFQQRCDQNLVGSKCRMEFEETTSHGRAAARQKAEHISLDERGEKRPRPRSHHCPTQGPTHTQDGVVKMKRRVWRAKCRSQQGLSLRSTEMPASVLRPS
jgi:hypothetical protein